MKKIFKFPVAGVVEMQKGAEIIEVAANPLTRHIEIWALVDPEAEKEERYFLRLKTGESLPDEIIDCVHLQTIRAVAPAEKGEGTLVAGQNAKIVVDHVFEVSKHVFELLVTKKLG